MVYSRLLYLIILLCSCDSPLLSLEEVSGINLELALFISSLMHVNIGYIELKVS